MLYHFVYDPKDPSYPYTILSDDMKHKVAWDEWKFNKYTKDINNYPEFSAYLSEHPRFIHVATYDYPIPPSEIMQLHPEYFI